MTKLVIAYRSFANAPENDTHSIDERHWPHMTLIECYIRCLPSALLSRLFEIYIWGSMAATAVALEGVVIRDNTLEPYNNGDKRIHRPRTVRTYHGINEQKSILYSIAHVLCRRHALVACSFGTLLRLCQATQSHAT